MRGYRSSTVLHAVLAAVIVFITLTPFQGYAYNSPGETATLSIVFSRHVGGAWSVEVSFSAGGVKYNCTGIITPNPYYYETRVVTAQLVVVPLYYVVESVCPSLALNLAGGGPSHVFTRFVELRVVAPAGCIVRSGVDWRGYGPLGGPYRVPARLFYDYYLYDGLIVACGNYSVFDGGGVSVIAAKAFGSKPLRLAGLLACIKSRLAGMLGPSPRSPVALVVDHSGSRSLLVPGSAFSLGGVVYVKHDPLWGEAEEAFIVAHEAAHAWLGKGVIKGDSALVEGAAVELAVLALKNCTPDLASSVLTLLPSSPEYLDYYRIHNSIREAGVKACGFDIYVAALKIMESQRDKYQSLSNLLDTIANLARRRGCAEELSLSLGQHLLGVRAHTEKQRPTSLEHGRAETSTTPIKTPQEGRRHHTPLVSQRITAATVALAIAVTAWVHIRLFAAPKKHSDRNF